MESTDIGGCTSFADKFLCIIFCVFILAFSALFFVLPDKIESSEENRMLAGVPSFSLEALANGKYTSDVAKYYADQFPLRQELLRLAAGYDLALLSFESDGVMLGSGGYLIVRDDWHDSEQLSASADNIGNFAKWAEANGISCTVAVPGRSQDVLDRYFPAFYSGRGYRLSAELEEKFAFTNYVDLISPLKSAVGGGEYAYYKTDHHWTGYGAYLAYRELSDVLGYTPYAVTEFDIEIASDEFFGTTWSSSGIRTSSPDTIEFWRYEGDTDIRTVIEGAEEFEGFYDYSYLDGKDKYSAFLSGNNGLVHIVSNGGEREKLLIVKDSFAHSLAPFLARHFDLVLVDLRYYNKSCAKLCVEEGITKVLFLCNADTLYSSDDLRKLNMGLK